MKRNYWPFLFIGIFTFTLGMIIWTIYSSTQAPVNQDESFLNTYQNVDENFNDIAMANENFLNNYDFVLKVNKQEFGLTYSDIFYSQRVIESRSPHKDILNVGDNQVQIIIKNRATKEVISDAQIALRVTRATNNKSDINLESFEQNQDSYQSNFELTMKGNWNITGVVSIGDNKGYIFLKTNAI